MIKVFIWIDFLQSFEFRPRHNLLQARVVMSALMAVGGSAAATDKGAWEGWLFMLRGMILGTVEIRKLMQQI